MKELNFAILGFGKMGKIRYTTIKEIEHCHVSNVYDIDNNCKIPSDLRRVSNPDEIFNNDSIDAIVISASNDRLKEYVIKGLRSGKHVFCEKPPSRNLDELNEITRTESECTNLKLMFGFNHRHHESIIHAKSLIDSGEYGKVLWLRGRYGKSVDKLFFDNWRSKKELAGGGILLDQGIHMLDLFLMICDDFDEVKAFVSNLYWKLDIEDNVFAIFRNKNGQVASLHSTMTQWRHIFSLEIFLEKGYITINGLKTSSNSYGDEVLTIAKNRTLPPEASWTDEEKHVYHVDTSWKREMNIFIDAIQNDSDIPIGNTKDAYKVLRLVERIYKER